MRMTRGWTGQRTSVIASGMVAVAVALFASAPARADATDSSGGTIQSLMQYSTAGAIGTTGISGPNVISFNSIPNGVFTASSARRHVELQPRRVRRGAFARRPKHRL